MPEVGHGGQGGTGGVGRIVISTGGGGMARPWGQPLESVQFAGGPVLGAAQVAIVRGTRMFEFGNAVTSTVPENDGALQSLREMALEQGREALAFTAVLYDIEWVDPLRVLFMYRLARHPQRVGDLLPAHAGSQPRLHLRKLKTIGERTQRSDRPQPYTRIARICRDLDNLQRLHAINLHC